MNMAEKGRVKKKREREGKYVGLWKELEGVEKKE